MGVQASLAHHCSAEGSHCAGGTHGPYNRNHFIEVIAEAIEVRAVRFSCAVHAAD